MGRVWEQGGAWQGRGQRQKHQIRPLNLGIQEAQEVLWLHAVEENVLMVEVIPGETISDRSLGQVILRRLIDAEAAIARLATAEILIRQASGAHPPESFP